MGPGATGRRRSFRPMAPGPAELFSGERSKLCDPEPFTSRSVPGRGRVPAADEDQGGEDASGHTQSRRPAMIRAISSSVRSEEIPSWGVGV